MSKLYIYAIFHANLSFSSIPEEKYSKVIDRSYWPLLELVKEGHRLGLEFSSSTLEEINRIDPNFVTELKECWENGLCEIVGSSYIQSIFPLIPQDVNIHNLEKGIEDYRKLLGRRPDIAFINEQTYSKGLPLLYKAAGYKGIIMDWDNAAEFNEYPPCLRYRPVKAGSDHLPVIWNSSLNSYKFQRCIYGRLSKDQYIKSTLEHYSPDEDRALPLYGTDWEIFNFRPSTLQEVSGEVDKIGSVLRSLTEDDRVSFILPSEVSGKISVRDIVNLETPESPLPCKNRDDYNVLRWAVSGRDDVQLNTQCHRLLSKLSKIEYIEGKNNGRKYWNALNFVWGSDFRTRTTDEKFFSCRNRMGLLESELDSKLSLFAENIDLDNEFAIINPLEDSWDGDPFEAELNFKEGHIYFDNIGVVLNGQEIECQCEAREYYRDGSLRSVRLLMSPYLEPGQILQGKLIEKESCNSLAEGVCIDPINMVVKTPFVNVEFSSETGGDIRKLVFPSINEKPVIGYLPPVYYDHIGHSNDYYSGGIQVNDMFGRIYNDTLRANCVLPDNLKDYPVRIPVKFEINTSVGQCEKIYYVYTNKPRIDLSYKFYLKDISPIYFRVGIFTFNPETFDKNTLKFRSTNGTELVEEFSTSGRKIRHNASVHAFASARACLGATEGWLDVADKEKGVMIATDKSSLYSVPLVEYEEIKNSYLLRIYNSISESDETGKISWRGKNEIKFSLTGHNGKLDKCRKSANHMNRKLLLVEKGNNGKRRFM